MYLKVGIARKETSGESQFAPLSVCVTMVFSCAATLSFSRAPNLSRLERRMDRVRFLSLYSIIALLWCRACPCITYSSPALEKKNS